MASEHVHISLLQTDPVNSCETDTFNSTTNSLQLIKIRKNQRSVPFDNSNYYKARRNIGEN